MKPDYIFEIETSVAGIPCRIGVLSYESVRGSYSRHAASDVDYYGYTESDWEVLDRNGRRAVWLERKLTPAEVERIEQRIYEHMSEREDD